MYYRTLIYFYPPPTLLSLWNICALGSAQMHPPYHLPMKEGSEPEVTEDGVGGNTNRGWYILQGVCPSPSYGDVLTLPRADPNHDGWWLSGSHWQPTKGVAELGPSVDNNGEGGCGCADVGKFLPGHYTDRPNFWILDMGGDPLQQEGPGGVPPPGAMMDWREATTSTIQCNLILPHVGGGHELFGYGG